MDKTIEHAITITEKETITFLTIDVPGEKINTLTTPVMKELSQTLTDLSEKSLNALVIQSAKPNIFIAGADINEIKDITDPDDAFNKSRNGQAVLDQLAALPFPTIAAIQGACLGGGCELALACDYRIASDSTATLIGLPEVNLGIIPGFGGTQRLPKLIGLQRALPLILQGKPVNAKKAYRLKLIDDYGSEPFFDIHVNEFIQRILDPVQAAAIRKKRHPKGVLNRLLEQTIVGHSLIFSRAKKTVIKATKGQYPAPLSALKAVKYGRVRSLKKGQLKEAQLFSKLAITPLSKHLIQLFFTNEFLKKYKGGVDDHINATPIQTMSVRRAGVLGAGLMGGGIAWLLSSKEIDVRLKDIQWDAITQGYNAAKKGYDRLVKRRRLTPQKRDQKMLKISSGLDYTGFDKTDVVIEAIVEDIGVKKSVFKELENQVSDTTIIATNTSALSVTEMAEDLIHPERFIGMHFFSPVNRMPLVEVIPGEKTSPESIKTVVMFAKQLKKTPNVFQNCPGFLVNRILIPYVNEAVYCLQDGASIQDIDTVMTTFGMPLGPLALADEVGLDVGYKVAKVLESGYGPRMTVAPSFTMIYNQNGLLGKKTGRGFYQYDKKKTKHKQVNPDIMTAIQPYSNTKRTVLNKKDILDRLVLIMVNEAARCLDESVVESPELLDMAMVIGTGFPPFRGGLCRYIDQRGLSNIVDRLSTFSSQWGDRFSPATPLVEMAKEGKRYYN
jgi:3-hydroxyacyl-CoA dehydrogenase/enoyl-CoA hydratase/3-hydroxybutyryl-CoA epimerase